MEFFDYATRKYKKKKRKIAQKIKRSILKTYFNYRDLDFVIGAEISGDAFSDAIAEIAAKPDIKNIIEIGSSSGAGSTKSFVEAIDQREDSHLVRFYCMEVSTGRYAKLKKFVAPYSFVRAFNLSSISTRQFPTVQDVSDFYNNRQTKLNNVPLDQVLSWREDDIEYIAATGRDVNGVQAIKDTYDITTFDMCLIDGSEFTGLAELHLLIGAKYILLDDTETYKCREAFEYLDASGDYVLLQHNTELRNGFAVFERVN